MKEKLNFKNGKKEFRTWEMVTEIRETQVREIQNPHIAHHRYDSVETGIRTLEPTFS